MQAQQCLFFNENGNCNDSATEEHIIQNGLGGSLSSQKIVCANCNNFFSHELDIQLTELYNPIIKILSPFFSGKLKHKQKRTKLTLGESEQYDIKYVGGTANLTKINKRYSSSGELEKIIAPSSYPRDELEKLAKCEGVEYELFNKVPLTEMFPDAKEVISLNVTPVVIRAVLLDIIELAAYVSVTRDFPNIAQRDCLSDLRLWIRTGLSSGHFPPKGIVFAFAPVSDLLDSLFKPSTFSHRLVICFDYKRKTLALVAQFANTMPWVFILEDIVLDSRSLSILYAETLIDGDDQLLTNRNHALLDVSDIRWRTFSTATHYAREFAKTRWLQEFRTQNARAHYEFDLRNDSFIRERLAYYANSSHIEISASIDAIVKLMQNRYQGSPDIEDILEITKKRALKEGSNSANQKNQQVSLYRECLKDVKSKFGYPSLYI